jgi:heme/copper-type cytochrome/quinol oxidase subunit 4
MIQPTTSQYTTTDRSMRVLLVVAGVLVVLIGSSLFFLPRQTDVYFSWTIGSPFTAGFLGGAYLGASLLEFVAARESLWANARVAVPAVLLFTALTLVVTLRHLEVFHFDSPHWNTVAGTWTWFIVYLTVPIIMAVLWVMQARRAGVDPARGAEIPSWARSLLFLQGGVMFFVGVLLLVVPLSMAPLWAWPLTALTGRAVGAWGVGLGTAVLHMAWERDWRRSRPALAGGLLFSLLQLLNLARFGDEFNGSSLAGLLYIALLVSLLAIATYGLSKSRA